MSVEEVHLLVDPRTLGNEQLSVIMYVGDEDETYSVNESLVMMDLASTDEPALRKSTYTPQDDSSKFIFFF